MKNPNPEISPDEIRAIREYLGLSQAEAGKVIGGGPRAFTKYEAGTVKPSAAVVNALRHMQADPAAVGTLQGHKSLPLRVGATSPFEVAGEHIAALTERICPDLLRRLLNAEAEANNLPADGIQVASNIYAADGGVDGRIIWNAGLDSTDFLPGRLNLFQLKAGNISPSRAGKEVTKKGAVKGHGAFGTRGWWPLHHALCALLHPRANRRPESPHPRGSPRRWDDQLRRPGRFSGRRPDCLVGESLSFCCRMGERADRAGNDRAIPFMEQLGPRRSTALGGG